jgi:acyl carrier protein
LFIVGACPHSEAEDLEESHEMTATKNDELSSRIRKLLERELACDVAEIADDTPLVSSGLLDSVSIAFLLSAIEETEGIIIPDESLDIRDFETVTRMKELVAKYSASTSAQCADR